MTDGTSNSHEVSLVPQGEILQDKGILLYKNSSSNIKAIVAYSEKMAHKIYRRSFENIL